MQYRSAAAEPLAVAGLTSAPSAGEVGMVGPDLEADPLDALPRDQPAWPRDMLAVSARVRAMLAALRPVVVRVLNFWDHATSALRLGTRTLEIDLAGCYRLR